MSSITVTPVVIDAIRRHGNETYPDECCGALIGREGEARDVTVETRLPLANMTTEGPRRRFLVTPLDYRQAEAYARTLGAALVGFYHSHPDHPAIPSQYDLDQAWPNLSYVIVAVHDGRAGDLRSWRLRADRSRFDEEQVRTHSCQPQS